jgi:hypothetical protein
MPETHFPRRWLLGNLVYGSGVRVGRPSASALCAVSHRLSFIVSVNLNHRFGLGKITPLLHKAQPDLSAGVLYTPALLWP